MYSYIFFKENDVLTEFMNICINEYGMLPDILKEGYSSILTLTGNGASIGVKISNDPVCIEIVFTKIALDSFNSIQYSNNIMLNIVNKLIDCANRYNIVLGVWSKKIDLPYYKSLGFKVIEVSDKVWMEYSQLLN